MNKDRGLGWYGLIALTAVLSGIPAHAEDGITKDRILIGQAAGFTGSVAGAVKEQNAGARAYLDTVNAGGGVHGRKVVLVDDTGHRFEPSADGQAAFGRLGNASTSLSAALRPGESYTTDFVFDVPKGARGLRLLITEDDPETRLVIGHENSLLHKKIFFSVASAPPPGKAAQ